MTDHSTDTPDAAPEHPGGWETERLAAQLLRPGSEALLQMVFAQAGDYFVRVDGRPVPAPDAAEREIAACGATPGREVALLTLQEGGDPAVVLGWWRGNPEPEVALLGMLMVVPEHRGRGLAREAVEGLQEWLRGRGIQRIRTAVHAAAFTEHRLLRSFGFEQMSIRDHTELGLGGSHLALFERSVG
jgi:GNAT superfamily N-acetyltransferase